ncbi:uncharacterized protein LOC129742479 [Uranotaenia lowii]|uniref:uncharacterized protein LOC129742479 n=1 Tax=Uranotaenia lowii TaxID=190385 RepID=UPI00247945B5|nr:uncharacterized protein LOC129742479 [Uranotaenia lowii]
MSKALTSQIRVRIWAKDPIQSSNVGSGSSQGTNLKSAARKLRYKYPVGKMRRNSFNKGTANSFDNHEVRTRETTRTLYAKVVQHLADVCRDEQDLSLTTHGIAIRLQIISNGGGLAIYVRDDIKFTIKRNTEDDGYHHIGIEILHYGESITVHGIYRPPGYNFSKFINHLEILLTEANLSKPIFILGELNIPINRENDSVVLQYQSLLSCFSLAVSNNIVTRPASNNLLDHSIVRINDLRSIINCTFECDISDHRPVLTTYINKKALPEVKILSRRHTNREHLEKDFIDFLRNADFRNQDPNARLNTITERYQQLLVKHTHVTTAVVRMRKICPWMTLEIWQLLKSRDKILRKLKKNSTNLNLSEQMKRMNKQLQNAKRKAKIEYYEQLMNTSNMKILWKRINEMIGKNSKPDELTLNLYGKSVDSPLPVANAFNEFFTAIGQHLASQHHSTGNIDEFGTIKRIRNSIFLRPSTVREVITIISSLDPSKASGVDSFPVSALRTHHAVLAPILTSAFNDSVSMGKYPECLKLAVVHPVFKSGDPKALYSYRPISVLSAFSKVFEKLIATRLLEFLDARRIALTTTGSCSGGSGDGGGIGDGGGGGGV